ncbi:MAG: hypothetical protein BWY72_01783 [Bacteroidetes bacterium ADurb.Bin416]|nr:MAG: hypothetical protein BWY72_01783 [Bacteroidetes bacterium ADurb.Bin416]
MEWLSWETTLVSEYRVSMAGLKISTRCLAMVARFSRRMSSSVLPENMEPQITSIRPRCVVSWLCCSLKSISFFLLDGPPELADHRAQLVVKAV